MNRYFQDITNWPSLLNEHIFEKPTFESRPKGLMSEIDELLKEMRPCRYTWDIQNSGPSEVGHVYGRTDQSSNPDRFNQSDADCLDLQLDLSIHNLETRYDIDVECGEDDRNFITVSDSFLNDLSSYWLVKIIRAQQQPLPGVHKPVESCSTGSSHCDFNSPLSTPQPLFPIRMLKKTNSEPSHPIARKTKKSGNGFMTIQSMDNVRRTNEPLIKRRSQCIKQYELQINNRRTFVDRAKMDGYMTPVKSNVSSSANSKTNSPGTANESDNESDKTSASKVLHWLQSLPKDHQGLRNAKKIGKFSMKEKPRWVS